MDEAILKSGVNLIDTAEQYPIPSDPVRSPEGSTEEVIGRWMKSRKVAREKVVLATKITGGRNVTPKNIKKDCEGKNIHTGDECSDGMPSLIYYVHETSRKSEKTGHRLY